jgi:hypothetical protein
MNPSNPRILMINGGERADGLDRGAPRAWCFDHAPVFMGPDHQQTMRRG